MKSAELIWTIKDILRWGEERFKRKIPKPRLQIEYLLSYVLKKNRLDLYLNFDEPLSSSELTLLKELIKRCEKGEPIAYITGHIDFHDIKLCVTPSVLIPRPETEQMVDHALLIMKHKTHVRLLDLGCGSGAITLACLKHNPEWKAVAIDISEDAITLSQRNAALNQINQDIVWLTEDMENYVRHTHDTFDLIIANPPYISLAEYDTLDHSVKAYEPRISLTDERDGLFYITLIIHHLKKLLNPEGFAFIEFGYNQAKSVEKVLVEMQCFHYEILKDYQQHSRFIKISKTPPKTDQEAI